MKSEHALQYVYGVIRNDIENGKYSYGQQLPSERILTQALQVSRITPDFMLRIQSLPRRSIYRIPVSKLQRMYFFPVSAKLVTNLQTFSIFQKMPLYTSYSASVLETEFHTQ